jgi:N-methylhydantoinase B
MSAIAQPTTVTDTDPVTTEIVRHALQSAAEQMKRALIRTSFSPVLYETLDFSAALYDGEVRLLAQAPTMPFFMGTLDACVTAAVDAVGGEEALNPGDVVLYNLPYDTGAHQQDAALVMPAFTATGELVGYAATKAHWLDLGAKEPYCTDTRDVFQEGTLFPGVKIVRGGELNEELLRLVRANSRLPDMVVGDLQAELACVRTGVGELTRIVGRFGVARFRHCIELMFDHGEAVVRRYFERIPDGRYSARGQLDNDGISDHVVAFEIGVEVDGSAVRLDYTGAPDSTPGPINCPRPSTVSGSRIAIMLLAGAGEIANHGHFRPIDVRTRPGSLFEPLAPAPCFLYGWPAQAAVEAIFAALAGAMPGHVPAASAKDLCACIWWGMRSGGDPWGDGFPSPIGQGASAHADGADALTLHLAGGARAASTEVLEQRSPRLVRRMELAPDSGGPGRHRGGMGIDLEFEALEPMFVTSTIEFTKDPAAGLAGGGAGRRNEVRIHRRHGSQESYGRATALHLQPGDVFELRTGGGGGYGSPSERPAEAVAEDLLDGRITVEHARAAYPHAGEPTAGAPHAAETDAHEGGTNTDA